MTSVIVCDLPGNIHNSVGGVTSATSVFGSTNRYVLIVLKGTVGTGAVETLTDYVTDLADIVGIAWQTDDNVAVNSTHTWSGTTLTFTVGGAAEVGIIGRMN